MNKRLTISFVGTKFCGWVKQNNALSVSECLEMAIKRVVNEDITLLGCSRTDSGVHAKKYICCFKTTKNIPNDKFPLAINSYLDWDIRVLKCEDVKDSFHPAFDAVKKTYIYQIYEDKVCDPFLRPYVWYIPYKLDLESMVKASVHFLGTHDFSAFKSVGGSAKTSIRTIYDLTVVKEGNLITIKITADGFLYNMVRIIAGTLFFVGCGKIKVDEIEDIIKSKNRKLAGPTAPSCGLMLYDIYY